MDENNNINEAEKDTSTNIGETSAATPDTSGTTDTTGSTPASEYSRFQRPENNSSNSETNYAPTYYSTPTSSNYSSGDTSYTSNTAAQSYSYSAPADSTSEVPQTPQGFAIASLVLGIISIIFCCCGLGILCGIVGIILGCVQDKDAYGKKPTMAVVGIVLSAIGLVLSILMIVAFLAYSASLSTTNTF